jgi:hypothetical protein
MPRVHHHMICRDGNLGSHAGIGGYHDLLIWSKVPLRIFSVEIQMGDFPDSRIVHEGSISGLI